MADRTEHRPASPAAHVARAASPSFHELVLEGTPITRECVTRRASDGAVISRSGSSGRAATIAALMEVYEALVSEESMPVGQITFDCNGSKVHMKFHASLPPVTVKRSTG